MIIDINEITVNTNKIPTKGSMQTWKPISSIVHDSLYKLVSSSKR